MVHSPPRDIRWSEICMSQSILLVQDDAVRANAIQDALNSARDSSIQVVWVRRCCKALESLEGIAAILLDLFLPDSRGIETFDRVFRAAPNVPILVLIDPQDED